MKKQIIMVLFLILFIPAICYSEFRFGITGAVKEKVKELKEKVDEEKEIPFGQIIPNQVPNTPTTPSGPSTGLTGPSYSFITFATDPDGDRVQYRFDWGDGNISEYTSLVNSGSSASESYSYSSANTYSIKAQARDSNGTTSGWSAGAQISIAGWADADGIGRESINVSNTRGLSHSPSLYLDTSGKPHIAWADTTPGNYDIYYLRWNGSAWVDADGSGQESINISNNSGSAICLSLYLDTSGKPHIAWVDTTSENWDIYYLKWNGSAWVDADGTGQESINVSNNSGISNSPSLYLDGSGNSHIAWVDNTSGNYEIYYLKWNGSGWVDADGSGQESINISNNSGYSDFPGLYLDGTGNPHIVWVDHTSGNYEIYYLKWDGSAWVDADGSGRESINISNNSGHSFAPSLFLNGTGKPYIAWYDDSSGNREIYYLKWNGSGWVDADGSGRESINISNNSGFSASPSLYLDGSGNSHIAWADNTSGNGEIYYLKWNGSAWVDADGSGQESINISNNSGASSPSLSLDTSGNPHIAWYDGISGEIYYLKWSP